MTHRPWYAQNARYLLENRQQGIVPDGPIVVSLVGGEFDQLALFVRPDMPVDRIDWRMLVNLPVWVWVNARAPLQWVLNTVHHIAAARPKELILRFEQGETIHDIDVGYGHHMPPIADICASHYFQWTPINVGGTALGYRLKKALLSKKKYGEIL